MPHPHTSTPPRLNRLILLGLVLMLWASLACNVSLLPEADTPNTDTTPNTADGWTDLGNGIAYRTLAAAPSNAVGFEMLVVRIDPSQVQFRVHYQANAPLSATAWQQQLGGALAFINGNFFDENYLASGLVVADGTAHGTSYQGFGGMFAVDSAGGPSMRYLAQASGNPNGVTQAVQGFPMLVVEGNAAPTGAGFDDPARRSVIAMSRDGDVYFISTGLLGEISLRDLQTWLVASNLAIDTAFNLDGGRSSALYVHVPNGNPILSPAFDNLPVVLAVYPR